MASYFLVLALYLQNGRGLGALASGTVFTLVAVPYMVGTGRQRRLAARLGRGPCRSGPRPSRWVTWRCSWRSPGKV